MANGISMVFLNAGVGVSDVHNNYYCNDKYFNVEVLCYGLNQVGIFSFGCSSVRNLWRKRLCQAMSIENMFIWCWGFC